MSEIKPCPFCGSEPTSSDEFDDEVLFYGCTKDIDCPLYDAPFVNMANWNTRPIEDALQAENEWLKEELQQEKTRSQLNLEAEERRMLNITYYCAEIDRLNARIAELEAERRWIPVREQMPTSGTQWVLLKNGKMDFDFTYIDGGRYYWWRNGNNVTHWMPLPQPPEVQE